MCTSSLESFPTVPVSDSFSCSPFFKGFSSTRKYTLPHSFARDPSKKNGKFNSSAVQNTQNTASPRTVTHIPHAGDSEKPAFHSIDFPDHDTVFRTLSAGDPPDAWEKHPFPVVPSRQPPCSGRNSSRETALCVMTRSRVKKPSGKIISSGEWSCSSPASVEWK